MVTTPNGPCSAPVPLRTLKAAVRRPRMSVAGVALASVLLVGCEAILSASRSLQPAGFDEALSTFDALSQRGEEDREDGAQQVDEPEA